MNKVFLTIIETLKKKQDAVLCTILECPEGAARKPGTKMAVLEDGVLAGTIGGGTLELATIQAAKEVLIEKKSVVNMVQGCEGKVKILFQYLAEEKDLIWMEEIYRHTREEQGWIVYQISQDTEIKTAIYSETKGFHCDGGVDATLCDGKMGNDIVVENVEPFLYVEPIKHRDRALVFGGGHVGKALVPILSLINFDVVIYDCRPECAKKENFPQVADVICGNFCKINDHVQINRNDYVIVMTPNHRNDYDVLEQVLRENVKYVGCIGSRKKVDEMTAHMLKAGISEETINKVHMPIGIKLKAKTPEEVAISIAAELINCRAEE